MWPALSRLIRENLANGQKLVLEGSALRPEYVASLLSDAITAICLFAPNDFLRERMHSESGYIRASKAEQACIDRFVGRSLQDNAELVQAAKRHGFALIDVSQANSADELFRLTTNHLDSPSPSIRQGSIR
jgi:2-phosphoglycerate kinase